MNRILVGIITVVALAMVAYHLTYSQLILQQTFGHQNTHLFFAFMILFLTRIIDHSGSPWKLAVFLVLLALALLSTIYMQFNYQDLDMRAGGEHTNIEVAIGTIIVILVFIGCGLEFGPTLPILGLLFVTYAFFGHYLPDPWTVPELTYEVLISYLCINMEGVYGLLLGVSANYVFLFMVFAMLMTTTGAVNFFSYTGKYISRFFQSGSAVMAHRPRS